jgi:hypothetical protein
MQQEALGCSEQHALHFIQSVRDRQRVYLIELKVEALPQGSSRGQRDTASAVLQPSKHDQRQPL